MILQNMNQPPAKQGRCDVLTTFPRPTTESLDPKCLRLSVLAQYCAAESERFYRGQAHDARFAYELFRRALTEHDEIAWEYIYSHYSPLVESWVRRSGAFASSGETSEFFVGAAFTKFWRAIAPERFPTFSTLASLLAYLQMCTNSVVIDSVRAQSWAEVMPDETLLNLVPQAAPDEQAIEHVNRVEFWRYMNKLMHSEAEQVVLVSSFVLGMKPGEICEQRPDLFPSVGDVYNIKRNVLSRLSRNSELRQMIQD